MPTFQGRVHAGVGLAQPVMRVPPGPGAPDAFGSGAGEVFGVGFLVEVVLEFGVPRGEQRDPGGGFVPGLDPGQPQAQSGQVLASSGFGFEDELGADVALDMHQTALDLYLRPEFFQGFEQPAASVGNDDLGLGAGRSSSSQATDFSWSHHCQPMTFPLT